MDERKIHRRCRVCGACKPLERFERWGPGRYRRVCRGCRNRGRMRRKLRARYEPIPERYEDPDLSVEQHRRILEDEERERRRAGA